MAHINYFQHIEDIVKRMDAVIRIAIHDDITHETVKTFTNVYDILMDILAHVLPLLKNCHCCMRLADSSKARSICFYTMDTLLIQLVEVLEESEEEILSLYPNLAGLFVICQELRDTLEEYKKYCS